MTTLQLTTFSRISDRMFRIPSIFGAKRDSVGEVPLDGGAGDGKISPFASSVAEALRAGRGLFDLVNAAPINAHDAACFHATYRCITLIAGSMARLPIYFEDLDGYIIDASAIPSRYRRYAEILTSGEKISGLFFLSDLIKQQATDLAIFGNTFLEKTEGRDIEYHPAHNATSRVLRSTSSGRLYCSYDLASADSGGVKKSYNGGDLMHARLPRIGKIQGQFGLLGTSPLLAASTPLNLGNFAAAFIADYFEGGGLGNQGVISLPDKLDKPQAIEIEDRIHRKRTDGLRRRLFTVLGGGARFYPLNTDTQSSQMTAVRSDIVEDIARVYGIPGSLVGIKTTEVGSGLEELTKIFVRFSLMQYREALETAYSHSFFGGRVKLKFDVSTFSAADLASLSRFFTSAKDERDGGIMTRDELRSMVDVPMQRPDD